MYFTSPVNETSLNFQNEMTGSSGYHRTKLMSTLDLKEDSNSQGTKKPRFPQELFLCVSLQFR